MASPTNDSVPQTMGRYKIQERIGTGGMARVYKGWDTNLDRTVAIKILHEHLVEDATFKERFQREAKFVAGLNHPNIVQVYDYSMMNVGDEMLSYMVMPYIPGQTLRDMMDELTAHSERMERSRILAVILNLTSALAYAHSRGMVHRDVKPSNIMFDEHSQAVLTDFGIARLKETGQLTQEGATVGTPTYISPEQAVGKPVDARSDLYALGVIVYELLAGEPPYDDETNIAIILKHINAPIPSITERLSIDDPELELFIQHALAKNPEDRFQTAQEFGENLTRILGHASLPATRKAQTMPMLDMSALSSSNASLTPPPVTAAHPSPSPTTTTIIVQRSPLNTVAVIIAIAALLIAIGILVTSRSEQPPLAATTTVSDQITSMTGGDGPYFVSAFSPDDPFNKDWPQTAEGTLLRQITDGGFYRFENQLTSTAATSIFATENTYHDATVTLEGLLDANSPTASGYGIVFRYINERNYNVFAVDGQKRFSIWSLTDGTWKELRGTNDAWTVSDFINPAGEKNRLAISFVGDHLIGTVNDYPLVDLTVLPAAVQPGAVGLYLATTSGGSAVALIDTYQVTGDIPSMTGSSS